MTRQPWVKTVWILTGLVVASIIAITALAYGYVGERNSVQAKQQALRTATCVNNVLALRNTPAAQDSSAYREIFSALNDVIAAPSGAAQTAAFVNFEKVLAKDQVTLNQDQAFRNAHPLGLC